MPAFVVPLQFLRKSLSIPIWKLWNKTVAAPPEEPPVASGKSKRLRHKRPTIREVAREAGLALSTVSNALTNQRYVSPATRRKVLDVADKIGYRASFVARSMRTQRTYLLGILVGDIANPFFPELVRGVEDAASADGYNLVLCNTDYREEKQNAYIQILQDQQIDGFIIASQIDQGSRVVELAREGVPIVLINQRYPGLETDYVGVDNVIGMNEVCQHLWQLGHRRIGFIMGREGSTAAADRFEGFMEAMKRLADAYDPELIQSGDWSYGSGATAAKAMLAMPNRPTAIVGANDLMALGAIDAVQENGLRTPQDVSIVGVDDIFVSSMAWASLTTLRHPKWTVGATAARLLMSRIAKPDNPISRVMIPPEFIVRATTGVVPEQARHKEA